VRRRTEFAVLWRAQHSRVQAPKNLVGTVRRIRARLADGHRAERLLRCCADHPTTQHMNREMTMKLHTLIAATSSLLSAAASHTARLAIHVKK
jgi:hypothetical protein